MHESLSSLGSNFRLLPGLAALMQVSKTNTQSSAVLHTSCLCRSPVYATFTEALDGAASIRAYDAQHRFCQLNEHQVGLSQQAAFAGGLKHLADRASGLHSFFQLRLRPRPGLRLKLRHLQFCKCSLEHLCTQICDPSCSRWRMTQHVQDSVY